MIKLCSNLRVTDGLASRALVVLFFGFINLVPLIWPEGPNDNYWLIPVVTSVFGYFLFSNQHTYIQPQTNEVSIQRTLFGLPLWLPKRIPVPDVCSVILRKSADDESWDEFLVDLQFQHWESGVLGELQSLTVMQRRGDSFGEAKLLAQKLGVKLHQHR